MKIRQTINLLVFSLLVITAFWNIRHLNKPVDISYKLDPKVTAQQFFGKVPYEITYEASKRNIAFVSIAINKNDFSSHDLNQIEKQLSRTWKLVEKTQYDHVYCKDAWNEIAISLPVSKAGERDQNYEQRFNTDKWLISIAWQSYGIDACKHLL